MSNINGIQVNDDALRNYFESKNYKVGTYCWGYEFVIKFLCLGYLIFIISECIKCLTKKLRILP